MDKTAYDAQVNKSPVNKTGSKCWLFTLSKLGQVKPLLCGSDTAPMGWA